MEKICKFDKSGFNAFQSAAFDYINSGNTEDYESMGEDWESMGEDWESMGEDWANPSTIRDDEEWYNSVPESIKIAMFG